MLRWSRALLVLLSAGLPLAASAISVPLPGERNLEIHGFYELRLRFIGDDLPANDVTFSQFRHVLSVETSLPLFPDGVGPLDFVLAYTRWQVSYECIYQRACGLSKSANTFGGSERSLKRLPANLVEAHATNPSVGGTALIRQFSAGTLRRSNEELTPGHRPRSIVNPPGVITNPNPVAFIANLNARSRLDGPIDQFAASFLKTRAGAYQSQLHPNYLSAARRAIGEDGFALLQGKFNRGDLLVNQFGELRYMNSRIAALNRDPKRATDPARQAEFDRLLAQRNELLIPGGDPDNTLLDYFAIDPDLQREYLFPVVPGSDRINLIATRPDANIFLGLAEASPQLLTARFGASQGPRGAVTPYIASLDLPIRPLGYFGTGARDVVDNAATGIATSVGNLDTESFPDGVISDSAFGNQVVPRFVGPDGQINSADDLPFTGDQLPEGLTLTSEIPQSTWAQDAGEFRRFTQIALVDGTIDNRRGGELFETTGKPLILFGVLNPQVLTVDGCRIAGGTLSGDVCTDGDGDVVPQSQLAELACKESNSGGTFGGINAQGDCLSLNFRRGSPLRSSFGFVFTRGVHSEILTALADPKFRPTTALAEPVDLTDFKGRTIAGNTPPARPPSPEGGSLTFRTAGLTNLLRKTHHLVSNLDQDFREDELRWGHGASQDEHEFREGFIELEMMRGQLFARLGKLLMIWGKTELFRNVDRLNPVDLSDGVGLGRLEETRVGQWGAQFVVSPAWAMRVGPFRDLRLEFAVVLDDFEPSDVGRCGETGALVASCLKGFGAYTHGLTGLGLVGEIRPDDQYSGLKRFDYGIKLDGHWGRFAFSISDYWGWDDNAIQEVVFRYARRVDPDTGAPVNPFGPLECKIRPGGPNGIEGDGDDLVPSQGNCLLFGEPNADGRHTLRFPDEIAANQSANQTLFHLLCTLTFDPDNGYCAFDQANDPSSFTLIGQVLSGVPGSVTAIVLEGVESIRLEGQPNTFASFIGDNPLPTATGPIFRELPGVNGAIARTLPLSPKEGALIGCGPAFVSACGEFDKMVFAASPAFLELRRISTAGEQQGGLDVMNADASVLTQEFTVLKGLQPGALIATRPGDNGLRYETGVHIAGRDVSTSTLGLDAEDFVGLSVGARMDLIRSRLEEQGGLAPGEPLARCKDRLSSTTACTDAWIEPMPWEVDQEALAAGSLLFKLANQNLRDGRCDPEFRPDGSARPREGGVPLFSDREIAYCTGRQVRWTPAMSRDVVVLNDPTDPTNPGNDFIIDFDGTEEDLWNADGTRSGKLLEWAQRVEEISEHCTPFLTVGSSTSSAVAGRHFDHGCTSLETISANFERFFVALELVGGDRIFDPPETIEEIHAMLDSNESNDTFGDPIAGADGIVAKNSRIFRDPATGLLTTVNDVQIVQFKETLGQLVSTADIAPDFDFDGDGVGDGAPTLDLSSLTLEEFLSGVNPDAACPNTTRCHLQTGFVETVVGRGGAAPEAFPVGIVLPIAIQAELLEINGERPDRSLRRPRLNFLELFHRDPLTFARLWEGQKVLLENFSLRYSRAGVPAVVTGDILLEIDRNVMKGMFQSFDGDGRGILEVDQDRDGIYDGLDDGAPGPISDDNILCGSGLPGDVLQSVPQSDPYSEAQAVAIAALGLPTRSPVHCGSASALLGGTGQTLPLRQAGGDGSYGRRDFIWHGGEQLVLTYDKRNILGFGVDFSEDRSKTSWNIELSWANDIRIGNSDRLGRLSNTDEYALTVSIDRPTFVRILNPSRTFFLNLQFFLRYLSDYHGGASDRDGNYGVAEGPVTGQVSFTFFTGYFQDRLQPRTSLLWEPQSASAAILWNIGYRFRPNLQANIGVNHFFGRNLKQRNAIFPGNLNGNQEIHGNAFRGQSAAFNEDTAVFTLRYSW